MRILVLVASVIPCLFLPPAWTQQTTAPARMASAAPRSPEVAPDRKVTFRLLAPKAVEVTLTGEFINDSAVTDGTGRFAGATGSLSFHGFVEPDGTFTDDAIDGEICVDLP